MIKVASCAESVLNQRSEALGLESDRERHAKYKGDARAHKESVQFHRPKCQRCGRANLGFARCS